MTYIYNKKEKNIIASEMEKPDEPKEIIAEVYPGAAMNIYFHLLTEYDLHIATAPRLEIIGEHKWLDGQTLVEWKDFRKEEREDYIGGSGHTSYPTFSFVAIPLPVKEEQSQIPINTNP